MSTHRIHGRIRSIAAALAAVLALASTAPAQQPPRAPRLDHSVSASTAPSTPAVGGPRARAVLPDTVRVLAVMAEFQADDDARTSGTGKFSTVFPYDYGADIIDPLPHNREYFQAHLRFLENYVRMASGGRTAIVGHVLDGAVTVPKKIQDYTFRKNEAQKPVADLAVDAWTAANAAFPGFDFSAYQMFVVFHAGRGRDINLASLQGVDPTPFDIPSLSFTIEAFRRHYGSAYPGIPVQGGAFHITNTAILPSTDTREIPLITGETGLLELSINGLLAASFGTYAGLPDLFDTNSGVTGIGRFGLMDAESIFAYGGICPPAPSAWEMEFLGWTSSREARAGSKEYFITAQRTDQPSTADVLKVPVNGSEYWLIENRQRDPGGNGQRVTMRTGGQDFELRFPKDTTGFTNSDIYALKGVVVDVEDLDWSLPGGTVISDDKEVRVTGGILIWHIDETVIAGNLATNTVNADDERRGVDLEQAAGPQDIGKEIRTAFGTSIGTGSPIDFWFKGNISPLYSNAFTAASTPNTRANSGAYSHVTIDDFSSSGPVMSFRISLGDNTIAPAPGFPIDLREFLRPSQTALTVQTADLDADGAHELLVAASEPAGATPPASAHADTSILFAFRQDGTPVLPSPVAALIHGMRRIEAGPIIGDITGDGIPEIVLAGEQADRTVSIAILEARDADGNGTFDPVRSLAYGRASFSAALAASFLIRDGALWFALGGTTHDTLVAVTRDVTAIPIPHTSAGSSQPEITGPLAFFDDANLLAGDSHARLIDPARQAATADRRLAASRQGPGADQWLNAAVSDFDGDGRSEGFVLSTDALSIIHRADDPQAPDIAASRSGVPPLSSFRKTLAVADVDGDGRNDGLIADSTRLLAFNHALASIDDYPAPLGARYALSARLTGEGRDAVFVVGDDLSQLLTNARQADGFPVPLPGRASVVLCPVGSGTKTLGVAVAGDDRRVTLYNTPNILAANSLVWRSRFADERNSNYAASRGVTGGPTAAFFPAERCYNWPNPAYEHVTKFRLYVSRNADVTVKIYDLAGDKVDELRARAIGGTDNEFDWDVSTIQSGVYLAHITAVSGPDEGKKIIKVAVVK